MTKVLRISKDRSLPLNTQTSTIVVYGGKGMGKSSFGRLLAELLYAVSLRFAVIDPVGVWFGLRYDATGKGAGIKVLILGGLHGDMPIDPTSGAVVADLVVDEDVSVIIDISRRADGVMWSIGERIRFVRDYARRLYQRQGEKRRPIHQIIDEAARFAPQIVRQGEQHVAECLGAVAVLVEEGRNVGIGVTLLTQRSARLNKDVAELADCLIAFRIVGPNSMRAVLDWLGEHVEKARFKEIGEQLRSLPRGSALVISPGWLEFEGIVAMHMPETFDSSKTPEAGGKQLRASGAGAKPDLAKYQARMAEVIEQQKANDPKALKARILELEKQAAARSRSVEIVSTKVEKTPVERSVIKSADLKRIEAALETGKKLIERWDNVSADAHKSLDDVRGKADGWFQKLGHELSGLMAAIARANAPVPIAVKMPANGHNTNGAKMHGAVRDVTWAGRSPERSPASGSGLPSGEATILRALIQYENGLHREQLTTITGYKKSTRNAYIQRLTERGFAKPTSNDRIMATENGRAAMPNAQPLPVGVELQQYWLDRLPSGERAIFEQLIQHSDGISRDALTERTGYKKSTRNAYIQRLAAKELVADLGGNLVAPTPTLFA